MARAKTTFLLLVGTRKGAFWMTSDRKRQKWQLHGPFLKGAEINDLLLDTRGKPTLYAAANSYWFGSTVQRSTDKGKTWMPSEGGVKFAEGSDRKVARAWSVHTTPHEGPNVLYLGVDPGTLFRTEDGGQTWKEIEALAAHPTRTKWSPGAGGLMVHSLAIHPKDPKKMYVGISAAGVFATDDGGATWEPRNKGVLADFLPEPYPEVGQCVHHLELHPKKPDVLWQQNHCGVFRSEDGGRNWKDLSKGLPSKFGFPIVIDPEDTRTAYVIPEEGPEFRSVVGGMARVYKTTNAGKTWTALTKGLPQKNAYLHVFRQAFRGDGFKPLGLYFGTSAGSIYASRNAGRNWCAIVENLPEITSLSTALVDW